MKSFFVLSCFSTLFLLTSAKYFKIPQANGSFSLMTQEEIDELRASRKNQDFYNPYTDIVYHLWTPFNKETADILDPNDRSTLVFSNFQRRNPTRVIVHGWLEDHNAEVIQALRREYEQKGAFNVIGVDWYAGAGTLDYITAREHVKETGLAIGRFIEIMERDMLANVTNFELIGFDLGGHVVGFAGRYFEQREPLTAIVSLDPCSLLFEYDDPTGRLKHDDAKYVEVIHTGMNNLGFKQAIGTSDFFPNGGGLQPGCGDDPLGYCSHGRSVKYFIESIGSEVGFSGTECEDDNVTREGCEIEKRGVKVMGGEPLAFSEIRASYWLPTNAETPFAKG